MKIESAIYRNARSLSRNPLGIIALFIVLVYAVASVVISFADGDFYLHPYHPAVLFLTIFPIAVLLVFALLVAKYHRHLYAPQDYEDQADFFRTLDIPVALRGGERGVATSDTTAGVTDAKTTSTIDSEYEQLLSAGFVLVHQSEVLRPRTSPRSGLYRVRAWVEPMDSTRHLAEIESVTYRVWNDFPQPVLSTTDQKSNFDIWLTIYGEFPLLALIKTRSGDEIYVHRYIDLPGRPPD